MKLLLMEAYPFDWESISLVIFLVMNMMNILLASLSVFPAASHAKWCSRKWNWKSERFERGDLGLESKQLHSSILIRCCETQQILE